MVEVCIPVIVTSSKEGWVDSCLQNLMPDTLKTIKKFKIRVESARQQYSEDHPLEEHRWKEYCFTRIVNDLKLCKNTLLNLMVVGDSDYEMMAGKKVQSDLGVDRCRLRLVKFKRGDFGQMAHQQKILAQRFMHLLLDAEAIDIDFNTFL